VKILDKPITITALKQAAANTFKDMIKAVVDTNRNLVAIDAELHSDLESLLLGDGSTGKDLWGINLYPDAAEADFIEFDSLINIRPSQGNMSRSVDNLQIRAKITKIISEMVKN
jgi:hypothetical protein